MEKIYKNFIQWKARPSRKDDPQNITEFCDKYNVTTNDIIEFTERPEYADDLLIATLSWAKSKTPELIQLVYNEVKNSKNVADLERFLNVVHEIKRKDKPNGNQFNFFNTLTADQYDSIVKREAGLLTDGRSEPSN